MKNKQIGHIKKKQAILLALEQSLGVVTTACKNTDIPRSTFYSWMNDDEEFAKQVMSIQDITLDFAESQLFKQIRDNNTAATIFYLKTKGRNRGYVERQEVQHSGEIKEVVVNVKRTSDFDED